MKLSKHWLSEYIKLDVTVKELADALTFSGSKVESIYDWGAEIQRVVVGLIKSVSRHPDADRLSVCSVDVGGERPLTIVTGATNVKEGDLVPVALDGSTLPDGKKINSGKLRGVLSEGMLCSIEELGLTIHDVPYAAEDGILILEEPCTPGQDIREVLGLDDVTLEFEITNNRPDCLSVRGLARETAATFGQKLDLTSPKVSGSGTDVSEYISVQVDDPSLCPRYACRIIKNVKIAPSPAWMRNRLRSSGVRPINNIVDITNYVMLEYGQPMHAFDYEGFSGKKIIVRRAQAGETMETIDGQSRPLTGDMLVIADEARPVALAGVMGGLNSEITDSTSTVVFESANFYGPSVRKTALSLAMRTESSGRFEKGLDPENVMPALMRACELVELLGAGEVVSGTVDIYGSKPVRRTIKLEPDRINAHLGTNISPIKMCEYLSLLGFEFDGTSVIIPSWRNDIEDMADLSEEIARLFGYQNIPAEPMSATIIKGGLSAYHLNKRRVSALMTSLGYSEILTYSFISPQSHDLLRLPEDSKDRKTVFISNPLGEDRSIMRTTAVYSMLETVARNISRRLPRARFFELARVYTPCEEPLPMETNRLCFAQYGDGDFFSLKGSVEVVLSEYRVKDAEFSPLTDDPVFHPGRAARIYCRGTLLGRFGQIHPLTAENLGINIDLYLAELDMEALISVQSPEARYSPLPRYPSISRDIAVVCERSVPAARLIEAVKKGAGALLKDVSVFDVYTGPGLAQNKKSIALSLVLRADDRTLTDAEADEAVTGALKTLESETGAVLRS